MTSHLWSIVQAWMDAQFFRVNQAQLAERVGVTRQAMSQWKHGAIPAPASLRRLADATRIDYALLLEAINRDMGYLDGDSVAYEPQPAARLGEVGTVRVVSFDDTTPGRGPSPRSEPGPATSDRLG